MFENVIGQDAVVGDLVRDIQTGILPNTVLFYGPEYSGKLTVALELARSLTCGDEAMWKCNCKSCSLHRPLIHPSVQILGSRYFAQEIVACAETAKRSDSAASRFLFLRSVRKLLRRLDPVLWDGEENRVSKALEQLSLTEEALEPFVRAGETGQDELSDESVRAKAADAATRAALKTLDSMPQDLVPVSMVRNIQSWVHNTSDSRRVIIIENVDRLGEASRNALLKILEEPPSGSYFVLTTSRRGAVIPTIRSRSRSYSFRDRPVQEVARVIHRIFKGPETFSGGIRDWFLEHEYPGTGSLRSHAEHFLTHVLDPTAHRTEQRPNDTVLEALNAVPEREGYRHFLQELLRVSAELLRAEEANRHFAVSLEHICEWKRIIQEHFYRSDTYNISTSLLLESLYLSMRDAVRRPSASR